MLSANLIPVANIRLKESVPADTKTSPERLIAEFVLGYVVLNIFIANFIG